MNRRYLLPVLLLSVGILAAKKPAANMPTLSAPANVYLRNTYDQDPSSYIGRFIKNGAAADQIDEASTFKSECSLYIQPKEVSGGDVMMDDYFNVSTNAGFSAGIAKIANLGLDLASSKVMRARYTLSKKLVSDIADPAGFKSCCLKSPDQCTDRYVGEFEAGVGAIYIGVANSQKVDVGVQQGLPIPGLDIAVYPEIEFGRAMSWYRGTSFSKPVYFAFKLYDTGEHWDDSVCKQEDWATNPPVSTEGQYFVGISALAPNEATARDLAMANAREQVVRYLGEQISTGGIKTTDISGFNAAITTQLQSQDQVVRAATGVAALVKDRCWSLRSAQQVDGIYTEAKVLVFLANAQKADAVKGMGDALGPPPTNGGRPPGPAGPSGKKP